MKPDGTRGSSEPRLEVDPESEIPGTLEETTPATATGTTSGAGDGDDDGGTSGAE